MTADNSAGPGERLLAARQGMEASTREVADALNLPLRVIEALEADDFEQLPPTVFTRGYLRSYARLLEIDPESVLALYPVVEAELDTGSMEVVPPGSRLSAPGLMGMVAAGIVVIVLGLWLLLGSDDSNHATPDDQVADVNTGESASLVTTAAPDRGERVTSPVVQSPEDQSTAERPLLDRPVEDATRPTTETSPGLPPESSVDETLTEDADSSVDSMVESAVESAPADPVVAEPGVTEPAVAFETEVAVPSRQQRRITEFGDDRLEFSFADDCWVEVKADSGENLYSDLNRAGNQLLLTGRGPFRILLGYAPGVELSFNGEAVDVRARTRNNVANLVVGR